jgi:hypothetical protein
VAVALALLMAVAQMESIQLSAQLHQQAAAVEAVAEV